MSQIPAIGRIVHYTLSEQDAQRISSQRAACSPQGNSVSAGDVYPMVIVRVWGDKPDSLVNGQVLLDGADTLWVTSVQVGEGPRTYAWPARV